MNMDSKQTYHAKAQSWANDRETALNRSRLTAWTIAAIAIVLALLEAIALAALVPLKSVQSIPILVDRHTGFVQVLKPDGSAALRADQALLQSFVAAYVRARESFNVASLRSDYRKVMLWSTGPARSDYGLLMQPRGPNNPLSLYPRSTVVTTQISSLSQIAPQTYMVRYTTQRQDEGLRPNAPDHWVTVVSYRFVDQPLTMADRLENPLGFQVVRYQRSPETIPSSATVTPEEAQNGGEP